MSLSDMQCRTAKPKEKPYRMFDSQGLYLEVVPSGSKYWRLKYRLHDKEKRYAIGIYPEIPLIEARRIKNAIKQDISSGIDPVLSRRQQKQIAEFSASQTFDSVAREWHKQNLNQWESRYAQTVIYRLERYVFPIIGHYPIDSLKPIVVLACLQKIEKTGPDLARRIKGVISYIFKYAIATDRVVHDPTYGLESAMKKYKKGHFAAIEVEELPELLVCLDKYKTRLTRQTYLAMRLMLLTFVRTKELVEAKWSEFDLERGMWTIPAERMKMKKQHLVPLSKQAIDILTELKNLNGKRDHVFPGRSNRSQSMSKNTILVALGRMKYKNKMTGHGFRSLALGVLKEKLNIPHDVADRQLAHVPKSSVDRAYDRAKFLPQRTEMMQRFADYLDNVLLKKLENESRTNLTEL